MISDVYYNFNNVFRKHFFSPEHGAPVWFA